MLDFQTTNMDGLRLWFRWDSSTSGTPAVFGSKKFSGGFKLVADLSDSLEKPIANLDHRS